MARYHRVGGEIEPHAARLGDAARLPVRERMLLFCIASKTDWQTAGVTGDTVTAMVIKGLVDRDAAGRLSLTHQGRTMLTALFE